ncbi:MBL fold metallo-hydrolase [Desmospora activa]|uniref:Glyoxylase-like metal-dependent hydrolase (Beta-lactamase superfamily II) n=1 Tax=Desmospora activa DSM 45169 TaxID=1121389 RepID=A0A2T4ZD80_9BACL|nr:MBL fold metallo-hydrolase [Desmospora activa]PTM59851.1 glyoxylase-like metal-dependent hydrolase (beta-lactamase superfamily II) [Desmospora activa DSM 45169]
MSNGSENTVESTLFTTGYCRQIERFTRRDAPWRMNTFDALVVLIHHPRIGYLLFDTGYATHFFTETSCFPYSLYRAITPVIFSKRDALVSQLNERGIPATAIRFIFLSHFHGDHIAGVRDFPDAVFICSQEAYQHIRDKRGLAAVRKGFVPGLLPPDFSKRVRFIEDGKRYPFQEVYGVFDPVYDLFGDESLLAVRLSGHAPGQYGLFFTDRIAGPTLLCADAAWSMEAIRNQSEPHPFTYAVMGGKKEYRRHFQQLVAFHQTQPQVRILPSHCPEARSIAKGGER